MRGSVLDEPQPAASEPLRLEVRTVAQSQKFGILLVEDQEDLRRLLNRALRQAGFRVIEAANGEQALAAFGSASYPVHLLLTDVVMPGINGCDLAREICFREPGIQVLLMSGCAGHLVQPGVPFLQKPFGVKTLLREVRRLLGVSEAVFRDGA
jgi:two-component system cell cycle sensor histidine kinase/response regulator CckA